MIKDMNILYEDKQTHRLPGHGEPFKKSYQHDFW